jgi:hypothetical protein
MLDNIHGGHGQTSTIHKTTDVAANVDVVQVKGVSDALFLVVLTGVFLALELALSEFGIVVDRYLGISCEDLTRFCHC